jgi:membrane-bound metal-dependent hydrolase YbcI (DUF457 family)
MDTITHGIIGALTGKALFAGRDVPAGLAGDEESRALSSATARAAIVACTVGSMFPDIDIFAGPLAHNPLAIMEWHRNITHSALLLPLWAVVLAAVSLPLAAWVKWKAPPFLTLFAIYATGIATHIFLDLITSFGTMVWSPLRYSRPSWDWVFILDLTVTGLALAPQLIAWCYREPRRFWPHAVGVWAFLTAGAFGAYWFARSQGYGFPATAAGVAGAIVAAAVFVPAAGGTGFRWTRANWCRAGLALICVYIALAASAHHRALADARHLADAQNLQVVSLAALPLPPTLTHWEALVSTPDGIWRATFHEPGGAMETKEFFANAPDSSLIDEAEHLHDVQVFLWFARFPVWRVRQRGNETVIGISDVRFFRTNVPEEFAEPAMPKRASGIRPRRAGFTFEVVFNPDGKVVSSGFREDP